MSHRILVLYGSYRSDRMGIRLAQFVVEGLRKRGDEVELIDARAVGLPMLDRMYKEYPKGEAPAARRWSGRSRGSPMIWRGGWRRPRRNARGNRRRIERRGSRLLIEIHSVISDLRQVAHP